MANTQQFGGLRIKSPSPDSGTQIAIVGTADSATTAAGDPVQMSAAASASIGAGEACMQVIQGTATSAIYGVCQSTLPQFSDGTAAMVLTQTYRSASTQGYILLRLANNIDTYQIQDDGILAGMASGHLNYNYKLVAGNTDTAHSGLSIFTIDSNNGATTSTYPLKVLRPLTDATTAYCTWEVLLNNVVASGGTGTVGI